MDEKEIIKRLVEIMLEYGYEDAIEPVKNHVLQIARESYDLGRENKLNEFREILGNSIDEDLKTLDIKAFTDNVLDKLKQKEGASEKDIEHCSQCPDCGRGQCTIRHIPINSAHKYKERTYHCEQEKV